jgi:hypothetical protein
MNIQTFKKTLKNLFFFVQGKIYANVGGTQSWTAHSGNATQVGVGHWSFSYKFWGPLGFWNVVGAF